MWALRFFPLLCYYATLTAAATKTKPIGDDGDCRFTIIVNSASTAVPIGLPPKMAEFCHTSNRWLLVRQCRRALLWLYFNSSATGRLAVGGRWSVGWWSVGNKGCRALGGSLQKDNSIPLGGGEEYFHVGTKSLQFGLRVAYRPRSICGAYRKFTDTHIENGHFLCVYAGAGEEITILHTTLFHKTL